MKDFMLIFISKDYQELGLSPEQMQARMGQWFGWNTKMREEGVIKHGDALHPGARMIAGPDRVQTDRPATESKEIIGGYYTVTARDIEHATEIAQGYPDYDLGGAVEIREVVVFE